MRWFRRIQQHVARPATGVFALLLTFAIPLSGQGGDDPSPPPSIEEKTEGMTHLEGFFDLFWDDEAGKLYWEIDQLDTEFLYQVSLTTGLGSNPDP